MIQDITIEKDDIKSNGIHVDGRNYTINFTGKLDQCTPDKFDVLHVSAQLLIALWTTFLRTQRHSTT